MMRLLITANPESPFIVAAAIAEAKGATVAHAHSAEQAMAAVRSGAHVNLMLVEVGIDIRNIARELEAEESPPPIVACGTRNDVHAAVAAIHAGARAYISLQPDSDIIAAMLGAVAEGTSDLIDDDDAIALMVEVAEQVKPSGALVRRTIADVERELILETLRTCFGNRTRAAQMLGISVRTLRNKINDYAAEGLRVPPAQRG
jgi:two-component system, response regulator FlrC